MTLQVRLARPEDMPAAFALRHEVFVIGQDVPAEAGARRARCDARSTRSRWTVTGLSAPVGLSTGGSARTCSWSGVRREAIGTIGRMAVAASARGAGVGRALLDALVARARDLGLPAVELHAQLHAKDFYERAGSTRSAMSISRPGSSTLA